MKKAVFYMQRVKDIPSDYSFEEQLKGLHACCEKYNLEHVATFQDELTTENLDDDIYIDNLSTYYLHIEREGMRSLLDYIEKNNANIDYILVYSMDRMRFSRHFQERFKLKLKGMNTFGNHPIYLRSVLERENWLEQQVLREDTVSSRYYESQYELYKRIEENIRSGMDYATLMEHMFKDMFPGYEKEEVLLEERIRQFKERFYEKRKEEMAIESKVEKELSAKFGGEFNEDIQKITQLRKEKLEKELEKAIREKFYTL